MRERLSERFRDAPQDLSEIQVAGLIQEREDVNLSRDTTDADLLV